MARPSQAQIDLNALRANYRLAQALAPQSQTLAVVKANAYGHGAVAAARALEDLVPAFAVACAEEALALREAGIRKPIALLEGVFSREEWALSAANNFWPIIENQRQVQWLLEAPPPTPVTTWLKVDTGMHRLGAALDCAATLFEHLQKCPSVKQPVVLATHFACADETDNPATREQVARLKTLASTLNAPISLANSPAILAWPEAHGDWNRPGYMLYGNSPLAAPHPNAEALVPVMTFQSRVISLRKVPCGDGVGYGATWRAPRDSLIATIPVGYGDGYPRTAPSGTPVLVNGQRAALAGRVSMDLITVDVTGIPSVKLGDPVELWGKSLSVDDVAGPANTSGYELLTRMPSRLRREYVGS